MLETIDFSVRQQLTKAGFEIDTFTKASAYLFQYFSLHKLVKRFFLLFPKKKYLNELFKKYPSIKKFISPHFFAIFKHSFVPQKYARFVNSKRTPNEVCNFNEISYNDDR